MSHGYDDSLFLGTGNLINVSENSDRYVLFPLLSVGEFSSYFCIAKNPVCTVTVVIAVDCPSLCYSTGPTVTATNSVGGYRVRTCRKFLNIPAEILKRYQCDDKPRKGSRHSPVPSCSFPNNIF